MSLPTTCGPAMKVFAFGSVEVFASWPSGIDGAVTVTVFVVANLEFTFDVWLAVFATVLAFCADEHPIAKSAERLTSILSMIILPCSLQITALARGRWLLHFAHAFCQAFICPISICWPRMMLAARALTSSCLELRRASPAMMTAPSW